MPSLASFYLLPKTTLLAGILNLLNASCTPSPGCVQWVTGLMCRHLSP